MDKESYQPMTIGHVAKRGEQKETSLLHFCWNPTVGEGRTDFEKMKGFIEREIPTSL